MSNFVKVNARDLIGPALDWAVATAANCAEVVATAEGISCIYDRPDGGCWANCYSPSTDWSQGGLLLEDFKPDLSFEYVDDLDRPTGVWVAELEYKGPTLLVAACRAFVADKLGGVVSVPQGLVKEAQHG